MPVYRNAETLVELARRLHAVFDAERLSFELLFVNDVCPAGSLAILEALARNDPAIAVLALERNVGQHQAVLVGLAHARGEWVVIMDADLQDQPEAIPLLLAKGRDGFAAVFAGRRGRYESRLRLLTSRLFKRLLHMLCGVPADAGLFVALHRRMVDRLLMMAGARPWVTAMIGCTGLPLVSVPVVRDQRREGSSAYSSWKRVQSGRRALAWVLRWKWRALRGLRPDAFIPPAVKAYVGERFAPSQAKG